MDITKLRSFICTHLSVHHPSQTDQITNFFGIVEVPMILQVTDSKIPTQLYTKSSEFISEVTAERTEIYRSLELSVLYTHHIICPKTADEYDSIIKLIKEDNEFSGGKWIEADPFANKWNPLRRVERIVTTHEIIETVKDLKWTMSRGIFDPVKRPR